MVWPGILGWAVIGLGIWLIIDILRGFEGED